MDGASGGIEQQETALTPRVFRIFLDNLAFKNGFFNLRWANHSIRPAHLLNRVR